jgi:signal transduction histidine kinase
MLTEEDFLNVEELNDLLVSNKDHSVIIQNVLERILQIFGQPNAALYISNGLNDGSGIWIKQNMPFLWQNQLDDPHSRLHILAENVISTGSALFEEHAYEIGTVLPVNASQKTVAALCLNGSTITDVELGRWQVYLRPLGRAISAWQINNNAALLRQSILALQSLAQVQGQENDLPLLHQTALEQLKDIFQAEDVLLIMLDETNPNLTITYQLSKSESWVEHHSPILEDTAIARAIVEDTLGQNPADLKNALLPWVKIMVNLEVNQIVCARLQTLGAIIGTVILINPTVDERDPLRKSLLVLIASLISNATQIMRKTIHFKIAIADIEANRWEIINSRNTLRAMFDSIPNSVYIIDQSYSLVAINLSRSNRIEKKPNLLVGKKCYEQLYNRIDPCPVCRVHETFTNAVSTNRRSREWIDPDRSIEWEIITFPIQEMNMPPHQAIIFEEDVTDQSNLEANLIQTEKLAAVGQLAAGVAHEINNPLTAIIANSQILKRELPQDNLDWIEMTKLIETAGIRAAQVVNNLLGIARKEKKNEFEVLSLNDTILSALSLVNHEIANRYISITHDLEDHMPDILANKNHLQGVWINMIVNAIDAIDDKPDGKIFISSRLVDNEFRVTIYDNGKGIPQDQLMKIFEPFYTTKSVGKGTGLGLSVCLRVIKEHRGTILAESQPGQGSKFIIVLPVLNQQI